MRLLKLVAGILIRGMSSVILSPLKRLRLPLYVKWLLIFYLNLNQHQKYGHQLDRIPNPQIHL